jgi:hypothetical protein
MTFGAYVRLSSPPIGNVSVLMFPSVPMSPAARLPAVLYPLTKANRTSPAVTLLVRDRYP